MQKRSVARTLIVGEGWPYSVRVVENDYLICSFCGCSFMQIEHAEPLDDDFNVVEMCCPECRCPSRIFCDNECLSELDRDYDHGEIVITRTWEDMYTLLTEEGINPTQDDSAEWVERASFV